MSYDELYVRRRVLTERKHKFCVYCNLNPRGASTIFHCRAIHWDTNVSAHNVNASSNARECQRAPNRGSRHAWIVNLLSRISLRHLPSNIALFHSERKFLLFSPIASKGDKSSRYLAEIEFLLRNYASRGGSKPGTVPVSSKLYSPYRPVAGSWPLDDRIPCKAGTAGPGTWPPRCRTSGPLLPRPLSRNERSTSLDRIPERITIQFVSSFPLSFF